MSVFIVSLAFFGTDAFLVDRLSTEGLFRVPGARDRVEKLCQEYRDANGKPSFFASWEKLSEFVYISFRHWLPLSGDFAF